jgi:hypothetical protein
MRQSWRGLKFKTDENLPLGAATTLRGSGFDVETVWDESLSGADDETIANSVRAEARNSAHPRSGYRQYSGILSGATSRIVAYLRRVVAALEERSPVGELWIVEPDRIRFRQAGR